jgi:hypothetical protein
MPDTFGTHIMRMSALLQTKIPCVGGHRPSPRSKSHTADIDRARCMYCDYDIFRSHITRRWVVSGQLG